MEGLILISVLLLTATNLLLVILGLKLTGFNIPTKKNEDKVSKLPNSDVFAERDQLPIDQFIPKKGVPMQIKYSDKDKFTKE